MRILYCGTGWLAVVERLRERLAGRAEVLVRDPERPLTEQLADVDVLIPSSHPVGRDAIRAGARLRLIQQSATGYEGIDIDSARERGIPVCNAPGQNAESVAEAALMLLLLLARRWPETQSALEHKRLGEPVGLELLGRRLGIVGLGRSGSHLARIVRGLGMEVLAVRRASSGDELLDVLGRADFVSLHCPLTQATRGLFDEARLSAMRRGSFLINTARAPIVDRPALEAALDRGHLAGYGADVHWEEPPDPEDPLLERPNVVALPHVAGATRQSLDRIVEVVVDNIGRIERGNEPRYRVA